MVISQPVNGESLAGHNCYFSEEKKKREARDGFYLELNGRDETLPSSKAPISVKMIY
jgi:hypothetical protein